MNEETSSEAAPKRPVPRVVDTHAFEIVNQVGQVLARGVAAKGVTVEQLDKGLYARLLNVQPGR